LIDPEVLVVFFVISGLGTRSLKSTQCVLVFYWDIRVTTKVVATFKPRENRSFCKVFADSCRIVLDRRFLIEAKFGGLKISEAKRLRELERDNGELLKIVAEQTADSRQQTSGC